MIEYPELRAEDIKTILDTTRTYGVQNVLECLLAVYGQDILLCSLMDAIRHKAGWELVEDERR